MTRGARTSEALDRGAPWARLLGRHRHEWAAQALGEWSIVDLAQAEDPAAALADAPERTAFVWLEGYLDADDRERVHASLEQAVLRGAPVVVGLELDRDEDARAESERLRAALGDGQVVLQELAAGSLIHPPDGDEAAARGRSVHALVCGNLSPEVSAQLGEQVEPLLSGYTAWLESANRELRIANARLGREHLGTHDAAAGAVEILRERIAKLEHELELQRQSTEAWKQAHANAEAALEAPRYRFVDGLRERAFNLPGVALALRWRSKRVSRRWES